MFRSLVLLSTAALLMPIHAERAIAQSQTVSPQMHPVLLAEATSPTADRKGPPDPPWAKDVNLTTEQRSQLRALREQLDKDTRDLREKLKAAHDQMRSLLGGDASPEQLRQQHRTLQALLNQMDDKHFEMRLAERQILTSEQRAQLAQLLQKQPPPPPPQR